MSVPGVDLPLDEVGGLVAIALILLVLLLGVLLLFVVLPLLSLLFALAVAAVLLLARVTGVATWTVRAVSADHALEWRVRGVLRSRRVMLGVARALERGGEALAAGTPPEGAQPVV
jgi:hypothetical protein